MKIYNRAFNEIRLKDEYRVSCRGVDCQGVLAISVASTENYGRTHIKCSLCRNYWTITWEIDTKNNLHVIGWGLYKD